MQDAAEQAALELTGHILGKTGGLLLARTASSVPVEKAAAKIADSFSPEISASDFGEVLRGTLNKLRDTVGAQKGQALKNITSNFPLSVDKPLLLDNTRAAIEQGIKELEAQKQLTPSLFAAGEKKAKTLAILQDLQGSVNGPQISTLEDMDRLRSDLFKLGQGMDKSLPKSSASRLTQAVHNDIGATLGQFGPEGNAAFKQFENASGSFRDVASTLETSTFKRLLNANVNQPEKLFGILMQAPESNLESLGALLDKAPNGAAVKASIKHLAIERAASSPQLLDSIRETARPIVFGKDLPAVEQFFDAVNKGAGTSMIQKVAIHAAGTGGGALAGAAIGHPIAGALAGQGLAQWLIRGGAESRSISGPELAIILGNPTTRDLMIQAAKTPASSKAATLLLRALDLYTLHFPSYQIPATQAVPPQSVPGGASMGEQLRAKSVALPQSQPTPPALPFHPGTGISR